MGFLVLTEVVPPHKFMEFPDGYTKKFKKETKKTEGWKILAKEMSDYFKKPTYHLFYDARWNKAILYSAYKQCKDEGKDFRYFNGILLNIWRKNQSPK